MKVIYIGKSCFINGLSYGDIVTVDNENNGCGYIVGRTSKNKTVVINQDEYEVQHDTN